MTKAEPCNLREWRVDSGRLLTCGRPGRGKYSGSKKKIPIDVIDAWADGLLEAGCRQIVSLLGWKAHGLSEFSYYPFRSCEEASDPTDPKSTFQEWLNARCGLRFFVREFRTIDDPDKITAESVTVIKDCVLDLLGRGHTVVIVDSAGVQRTGKIRDALGASDELAVHHHVRSI